MTTHKLEVESKEEGQQLQAALGNNRLRALNRVVGILAEFGTDDQGWILKRAGELVEEKVAEKIGA